jgi:hypothetical protein
VNRIISFAIPLFISTALASQNGTVPRSSAAEYPAHTQENGISIGAKLLSAKEVRKTFISNVDRCCIVLEIALYPNNGKPLKVSLSDFVLRRNVDPGSKPSSPKVVAASLQHHARSDRDIDVYPSTGIGYSSGTVYDPNTGMPRRAGGVYTQVGVGVGVGSNGTGASDQDRSVMETELTEKGLSEVPTSEATAGYIYFTALPRKKGNYQLQYEYEGKKLVLPVRIE